MAYQDLALRNVAGEIAVTYNDNNMRAQAEADPSVGPRIFATATAKTGAINKTYRVRSLANTMLDFDSRSEISDLVAKVKGANQSMPLSIARVGAKPSHFIIERDVAFGSSFEKEALITITPSLSQEEDLDKKLRKTLDNYKLILLPFVEGNLVRQRVLIVAYNFKETQHVIAFDSERLLQENGTAIFDVSINIPLGEVLVTPDAFGASLAISNNFTLSDVQALSDLRAFQFNNLLKLSDNQASVFAKVQKLDLLAKTQNTLANLVAIEGVSLDSIDGSVGDFISHVERYASNEVVYEELEFEDFQYLYCERCYADINPVELEGNSLNLKQQAYWHQNSLGHMWKFVFNGRPYIYMFARKTPFVAANVGNYVHDAITVDLDPAHAELGDLLNIVEFHIHGKNNATTSVESFVNKKGLIECHITVDVDTAGVTAKTPFGNVGIPLSKVPDATEYVFRHRPSLVDGARSLSDFLLANEVDLDPFVMTHFELVGGLVPEAVLDRLVSFDEEADQAASPAATLVAADAEVREVSFLHQSAQAAYVASTNYNQVIALVPTTQPPASLNGIAEWAGNPGTYVVDRNGDLKITSAGSGVLGTRLLAGHPNYRDGAAFGGVILTNGDSLPNKVPYGIDDQDEAVDGRGNAIDLGKHCVVVGAWGLSPSAESLFPKNGTQIKVRTAGAKFGNAAPLIASILNTLEPGTEPIGPVLGRVPNFAPQQRTPRKVLNDLAALRICMIDQTGVISSIYTSALRTSDYRKISSIISANTIVSRVRSICEPIIGQAYTDAQIASLQQTIEGVSRSMVRDNVAQSVNVRMFGSQVDRINGVLRCQVTFVPPLSIEAITIDLTLQAPQA